MKTPKQVSGNIESCLKVINKATSYNSLPMAKDRKLTNFEISEIIRIQQIWKGKLESLRVKNRVIDTVHEEFIDKMISSTAKKYDLSPTLINKIYHKNI